MDKKIHKLTIHNYTAANTYICVSSPILWKITCERQNQNQNLCSSTVHAGEVSLSLPLPLHLTHNELQPYEHLIIAVSFLPCSHRSPCIIQIRWTIVFQLLVHCDWIYCILILVCQPCTATCFTISLDVITGFLCWLRFSIWRGAGALLCNY